MISARPGALIPPARVVEIQQALIKRNYLQAPPTGVYDAATVSAMKAFQTAHKLEPTGYPTAQALDRLGLPPGPELSTPGDGPTERQSSSNSIGPASSGNKIPPQRQQR
jgi:peptidoglycan hydrolase-like protein with peptidoglycan-binding domain